MLMKKVPSLSSLQHRMRKYGTGIALLVAALCIPQGAGAHGLELSVQQLRDNDPAGMVGERLLTVGEVKTLLSIRSARYRPGANVIYGLDDLVDQIHYFPAYDKYADKAIEAGLELDREEKELLAHESSIFARFVFFQREIANRVPNPTLEMLTNLYEETKDTYFRTPEMYLLQKVSVEIGGDNTEDVVQQKLNDAADRINAGEPVASVFRELGQNPRSIAIYPDEADDVELVDALGKIENRQALSPRMEDDACVLYYRRLHRPRGYVPLQSSIDALSELFRFREQGRLVSEYIHEIARSSDLVRVVEVNLLAEPSLALEEDALLSIAGEAVTRGELRGALGWQLESIGLLDEEKFLHMALETGVVQNRLMKHLIAEKGIDQRAEVIFHRDQFRRTLLARKLLVEEALKSPLEVTDEAAVEQWRIERSSAGRLPGEVGYSLITMEPGDDKSRWHDLFSKASNPANFRAAANQLMREDPDAVWMTGLVVHVSELPQKTREVVGEGQLPAVSIVTKENKVHVYHLLQARPDEVPTEAELERARGMIYKYKLQDRIEEILVDTAVGEAVRILLPMNNY